MTFDGGDDGFECRQFFVRLARRRVAVISQTVAAMEPMRAFVRAVQWFLRAHEDRNVRAAKFRCVQGVPRSLLHGNISRHRGDCQHTHRRRAQRHDQGYGIIGSRVGVNQEERFHAA